MLLNIVSYGVYYRERGLLHIDSQVVDDFT